MSPQGASITSREPSTRGGFPRRLRTTESGTTSRAQGTRGTALRKRTGPTIIRSRLRMKWLPDVPLVTVGGKASQDHPSGDEALSPEEKRTGVWSLEDDSSESHLPDV